MSANMDEQCRKEVTELHRFFEQWFKGELEETDREYGRFAEVMADGFEIISPGGSSTPREELLIVLRKIYATQPESYRIWIENYRGRKVSDQLQLAVYEEWQQAEGGKRGRLSTVLFRLKPGAPNGVEWLHVHETWLPE